MIVAKNSNNFISIVSIWEIAIKLSLGRLDLSVSFEEFIEKIYDNAFEILPISLSDTIIVSKLPYHHNDPFDRLIIAQTISRKYNLFSKDKEFKKYAVDLVWN